MKQGIPFWVWWKVSGNWDSNIRISQWRGSLCRTNTGIRRKKKNGKEYDSESEAGVRGGVIWNRKIIGEFTRSISSTKIAYPALMMNAKSPKINLLADGLIERTSSILDEIASNTVHKDKEGDW